MVSLIRNAMSIRLLLLLVFLPVTMLAQTEKDGGRLSDNPALRQLLPKSQLTADSLRLGSQWMRPVLTMPKEPVVQSYTQLTKAGAVGLPLWRGAALGAYGTTSHMPGLLTTESGSLVLHQDLGRWHLSAMGIANKYWMPWQRTLSTQYGFGGTVGYDLNERVSLHAFGYYYLNQMQVGPAMSPFVSNTTYGGYADVRFSNIFGSKLGVRRYVNPMNGKWTTEPIVNPYIKIGKDSKIELPIGGILKALVWGDRDNPLNFSPRPIAPARPMGRPVMRP